jgi:integrase
MSSRAIHRLTPGFVSSKRVAEGIYHDGGGLYLQVRNGGRSWLLRYMMHGRARHMGLGRTTIIGLSEARAIAIDERKKIAKGVDPIKERKDTRNKTRTAEAAQITFEQATDAFLRFKTAEFKSAKHAAQWDSTLRTYAFPMIRKLPVQSIDTVMVKKILQPIWLTKTETATRLRQRIEAVLDSAFAQMNPRPDNPARWKGHLDTMLPKPRKISKIKNFEAMDYRELPAFFADLSKRETVSAKALTFTILTAARTTETRQVNLSEIKNTVWTVPGERMKAGRDHRVPLTKETLALVPKDRNEGLLFPSAAGRALSETAMRKYLQQDLGCAGLTVHGFRATFKTWAKDMTNVAPEIVEAALAHVTGDKTEEAYARRGELGDVLERRRQLMEMWSRYCFAGAPATGDVIPIRERVNA